MKPKLENATALKGFPEALVAASRLTLKVGSALMVASDGTADEAWMQGLAQDVAALMGAGKKVMIVSSGAVGLGRHYLGLKTKKLTLDQKQAAAAAGQPILMRAWDTVFAAQGLKVAQVLLTREDTEKRHRWLNARETVDTLLNLGVVPIVNENDTVATEEIRYGDNDRLAARAAQLMRAECLVLLSDVDGLYTADPRKDKTARHISVVDALTPEIEAMAGGANTAAGFGTGGMATKLAAAKIAGSAGCSTLIAHGGVVRPLLSLGPDGGAKHTLIKPQSNLSAAYKAWIAGTVEPAGHVRVDEGAVRALKSGKSLLPSGITAVDGVFEKGDSIAILSPEGIEVARGISAYGTDEIALIKGQSSKQIEALLGYSSGDEVIHRDDLVMV
jgi:glutamate 5-kinase